MSRYPDLNKSSLSKTFMGPNTNGFFGMEGSRGPQENSESVIIILIPAKSHIIKDKEISGPWDKIL